MSDALAKAIEALTALIKTFGGAVGAFFAGLAKGRQDAEDEEREALDEARKETDEQDADYERLKRDPARRGGLLDRIRRAGGS